MNNLSNELLPAEIRDLFENSDADLVWSKAVNIVTSIHPDFEFFHIRTVLKDVVKLFQGSYPEYSRIKTPYHDLSHTLSVFICALRLAHGVHFSGTELSKEEITLIMIAALLHDIGYAQLLTEDQGSGAQFIRQHIQRGVDFSYQNLHNWHLPESWGKSLEAIIRCTDLGHSIDHIPSDLTRLRLMGKIVASADIVGQMADRTYLEKLLFLYFEFEEAHFGDFQSMQDMLKKTRGFYNHIRTTLDSRFDAIYEKLRIHFKITTGSDKNYYIESIEKNISYLDKIIALNEAEWLSMLKRDGVVKTIQDMAKDSVKV